MAKFVFDIEATGLANCDSIDYTKEGHPLKDSFKVHCIVAQDVDTKYIYCFYDGEFIPVIDKKSGVKIPYRHFQLDEFKRILNSAESLIGHNIINYDMFIFRKLWGIDYTIGEQVDIPDTVNGRECFLDDTLVKSKLLNPDRRGGHSLESFGKRLAFYKGDYGKQENAWDEFTPEMLAYCIQDVRLNTLTHELLQREYDEHNGWDDAYCLEKAIKELVTRSEQVGFYFDKELAEWCVDDLKQKMDVIEEAVEPLLPRKMLPKSKQPSFPSKPFDGSGNIAKIGWSWLANKLGYNVNWEAIEAVAPPKTAFKANGEVSKNGESYCLKHGVEDPEKFADFIRSQRNKVSTLKPLPDDELQSAIKDLRDKKMPDLTTPMKLSDQKELKEYLVSIGWNPSVWKEDDITIDAKTKRKISEEQYKARVEKYVRETLNSPFCKYRCAYLKVSPENLREKLLSHNLSRPLKRWTSPKFTVDLEKTIDPNLLKLGDKVEWIAEVINWLTWRHRKNSILSPPNGSKKEWSGWLADGRIDVDHRIPTPADTCGCSSSRFQHRLVTNIPRVTSPYGEHMRALFGVDKEKYYQIGMDFDSLEAKIEAHYCYPYEGGEEYGVSLTAAKPNDIHSVNARKMSVPRGDAKTFKYACLPVENTQVLTPDGWKWYSELKKGDLVLSYNTYKERVEVDNIKKIHFYADADVIQTRVGDIEIESTEDHRWFGLNKITDQYEFRDTVDFDSTFNLLVDSNNYLDFSVAENHTLLRKDVFCLTTGNSTFIMKQGDFISITGNCSYGAQPPKLAAQMGWSLDKATEVFNAFWDASAPLKNCREDTIRFWKEKGDKKYIIGLDGRKLYARSEHSILNLLFQSAGVTCAKRAAVWWDRQVRKEKLEGVDFIIAYHK